MPTTDNDRLAAIRSNVNYLSQGDSLSQAIVKDMTILLAEVDRLRAELATAKAERDQWLGRVGNADAEGVDAVARYDALRAAHTWTVATPATMPPVGSGPWLVEGIDEPGELYALYSAIHKSEPHWMNKNSTAGFPVRDTHYAALPAEPEERHDTGPN